MKTDSLTKVMSTTGDLQDQKVMTDNRVFKVNAGPEGPEGDRGETENVDLPANKGQLGQLTSRTSGTNGDLRVTTGCLTIWTHGDPGVGVPCVIIFWMGTHSLSNGGGTAVTLPASVK